MRSTTPPIVEPGTLATGEQPTLVVHADLMLRPFRHGDEPAVIRAFTDPDIRFWHSHLVDTVEEATEWIDLMHHRRIDEAAVNWAVVGRHTDEVLGRCGLHVDLSAGFGELSYWVLPDARGKGIATRAAADVSDWAFAHLGLHRLEIEHSTQNPASCRVAQRVGFDPEGTRRSARLHPDGWHDMHVHARIAPP